MLKPFQLLLAIAVAYHLFSILFLYAIHENRTQFVAQFYKENAFAFQFVNNSLLQTVTVVCLDLYLVHEAESRAPYLSAFHAFLGGRLFFPTFTAVKASIPLIYPHFADPFWADLDKVLHFGIDPWKITHVYIPSLGFPGIPANAASFAYLTVWVTIASLMPLAVALFDRDERRKQRFVLLFFICWIGLGNTLAFLGLSVGPVFYDRVFQGARFEDFTTLYNTTDLGNSNFKIIQDLLWTNYQKGAENLGHGISAFPSVHVGLTTVFTLYAWKRFWALGVFLLFIFYYSIASGYHYAIDGYVSIFAIWASWKFLLRQERRIF